MTLYILAILVIGLSLVLNACNADSSSDPGGSGTLEQALIPNVYLPVNEASVLTAQADVESWSVHGATEVYEHYVDVVEVATSSFIVVDMDSAKGVVELDTLVRLSVSAPGLKIRPIYIDASNSRRRVLTSGTRSNMTTYTETYFLLPSTATLGSAWKVSSRERYVPDRATYIQYLPQWTSPNGIMYRDVAVVSTKEVDSIRVNENHAGTRRETTKVRGNITFFLAKNIGLVYCDLQELSESKRVEEYDSNTGAWITNTDEAKYSNAKGKIYLKM
ncbi:MAG: hypothetical protein IPF79_09175 [Ignavibacteria bacterium]|nr:hypothetical protein [Ignavibacteria bacterium]